MPDTQWPRYMVFQQDAEGEPLKHNGTVHAPDAEMALLNARDVFARRPRAVRMWVVPADRIYSKTAEELAGAAWTQSEEAEEQGELETYYACGKFGHHGQCTLAGEVEAASPQQAMQKAVEAYADNPPSMWWVFPSSAVSSTDAGDAESMFEPVLDKRYRQQAQYPTVTMMRKIRAKGKLED